MVGAVCESRGRWGTGGGEGVSGGVGGAGYVRGGGDSGGPTGEEDRLRGGGMERRSGVEAENRLKGDGPGGGGE